MRLLGTAIATAFFVSSLAQLSHAEDAPGASTSAPPPSAYLIPPRLISDSAVPYPEGASGDAVVLLVVTVNDDGTVRSAETTETQEPFDRAAAAAARSWQFVPATRADKPVAARIRVEVFFRAPSLAPSSSAAASESDRGPKPSAAERLPATPLDVQEVTVHGARGEPSRTATLSRGEVRQIPGVFGDPFRAIEVMPGVTPIVSGLPFFFVRGAPPGNVGYFVDGIPLPYLFHVGAGPSVVHPGLIDRVDLYPGGYPASFGRYAGGIVSGETVSPRHELHGEYNARFFDAGALIEVPFADERGTVLVGGRYSYTALLLSLLNSSTALDYWDYQARVTYDATPHDQISAFGFGSYDYLGQKTPTGTTTVFGAQFFRLDLRYDHRFDADTTMRTAVTGGLDRTQLDGGRNLRDRLVRVRNEMVYRASTAALVRVGTDAQVDTYDIELPATDLGPAQAALVNLFPSRTDLAVGARGDVVIDAGPRLQLTPGARFDLFGSAGATALGIDPRLSTRMVLTPGARLLSAIGIAHQTPSFVVPVPGFQPGGLKGGLQSALQESVGAEIDLGPGTVATASVFHNAFFDLSDALSVTPPDINGCRPGQFPSDTISGDPGTEPRGTGRCGAPFPQSTVGADRAGGGGQGAQSRRDVQQAQAFETRAKGSAYGLELYFKRKLTSRLGGFLSYTLSRSVRTANGETFIASFDRTHVLNVAVAYDLGRKWRAGTRVTFYTGLPKAPVANDATSTRLAPFFRLDLRLEKRWDLGDQRWISFVAEWLNATLSKESIGTSCTLQGCQDTQIGPVTIPSLGVEGGF